MNKLNDLVVANYVNIFRLSFATSIVGLIGLFLTVDFLGKEYIYVLGIFAIMFIEGGKWFAGLLVIGVATGMVKELFK